MFELHPAIEHMAEKGYERATLDEMAIVNTMRRSLNQSFEAFQQVKIWLQQENPLNLHGAALSEWATEVASWVLPTQMRSIYAPETRKQQEDGQPEHQDRDGRREATEASRRYSIEQSRQVE